MKSARWFLSYIVVAFVGLGMAFLLSLRFVAPAHSQTPKPSSSPAAAGGDAPSSGDLPPEFLNEIGDQGKGGETPPAASPNPSPSASTSPSAKAASTPAPNPATPPPTATSPEASAPGASAPSEEENPATGDEGNVGDGATAAAPTPGKANPGGDDYVYDPTGRRDPFKPYQMLLPALEKNTGGDKPASPLEPLQRWDVDRLKVIGILWDVQKPRAMLQDPDGAVYTVVKSTKVGRNNGYVAAIRDGQVVVIQTVDEEGQTKKETKILELGK